MAGRYFPSLPFAHLYCVHLYTQQVMSIRALCHLELNDYKVIMRIRFIDYIHIIHTYNIITSYDARKEVCVVMVMAIISIRGHREQCSSDLSAMVHLTP